MRIDEKVFVERIKKVEELNELILELKKAYIKSKHPELSKVEIEKIINRWKIERAHY